MFIIACVVYERTIDRIGSIREFTLFQNMHEDVQFRIYDNSGNETVDLNRAYCLKSSNIQYCPNNSNIGLSRTYNKVLKTSNEDDWIFWADDDTVFSIDYLENVYRYSQTNLNSLISGVIRSQTGSLLSPVSRAGKAEPVEAPDGKVLTNVYCINSGLCVKRNVYSKIGYYNEQLFVDMIDYWFFDELHKLSSDQVYIASGEIKQSFSGNTHAALRKMLRRYRIYKKDFSAYCALEKKKASYKYRILGRHYLKILYLGFMNWSSYEKD